MSVKVVQVPSVVERGIAREHSLHQEVRKPGHLNSKTWGRAYATQMPEEDLLSKRKNVDLRLMQSKPTCEAGSVTKSFNEVDGHKCRNPLHNS